MTIKKGEKELTVIECKTIWKVSHTVDKLTIDIQVAKEVCSTFEELKAYIEHEETF